MMYVKIYDCDLLNLVTILGHGVAGGYSHIINEAKSVAACLMRIIIMESPPKNARMVAWRPSCAKGIPVLAAHN
jgi:hypothetical protein